MPFNYPRTKKWTFLFNSQNFHLCNSNSILFNQGQYQIKNRTSWMIDKISFKLIILLQAWLYKKANFLLEYHYIFHQIKFSQYRVSRTKRKSHDQKANRHEKVLFNFEAKKKNPNEKSNTKFILFLSFNLIYRGNGKRECNIFPIDITYCCSKFLWIPLTRKLYKIGKYNLISQLYVSNVIVFVLYRSISEKFRAFAFGMVKLNGIFVHVIYYGQLKTRSCKVFSCFLPISLMVIAEFRNSGGLGYGHFSCFMQNGN